MLGWLEEAPPDEVPDESIWHHPKRLEEHWAAVKQNREHGTTSDEPTGEEGLMQNELTKDLRRR